MKNWKKILVPVLFCFFCCLFLLPEKAQASETVTVDNYTYTITDGTAVLSSYNGTSSSVTVPTSMTYNGVTYRIRTIGEYAFSGNRYIKTLVIPEGITSIGNAAFKNCTSLSSITINGNIGDCHERSADSYYDRTASYSVFYNVGTNADSLEVTFGDSVTYVPAYLFATASSQSDGYYMHVTSVNIPDSVTEIGSHAFYDCYDLKTVKMGSGLTDIDEYAFNNCTSLTTITWGSSLTTIGNYAFAGDTALTTLTLPEKLIYIQEHAFDSCTRITSVTLPASTTSLGYCAFKNCTALSSITINGNIGDCHERSADSYYDRTASYSVFYNAGTNADSLEVTFGDSVTYVPAYLFATASSQSDGYYMHVTSVNIPDSVTEIGSYAFYDCYDLKTVKMGSGLTDIDAYAFSNCTGLTLISWGSSLTTIGNYAFCGDTALTTLDLPEKLVYIQEHAFDSCTRITSVTLPASTTSLGYCAFKNCTALSSITINGNIGDCHERSADSYYDRTASYSVFYNAGANADSLEVTFGDSVTYVPAYLFATASSQSDGYYAHVTSVTFSTRLKEIGDYAFYDCYDLKSITFVRSAPTIGDNSFGNVQAYAYYPSQFSSWDSSTMLDYGGDLTWLSYAVSEDELSGDTLMVRRGNKYYFNYVLKGGSADFSITFGDASDQVLVGDWDGDGIDTICVRRGNVCYFIDDITTMNIYLTVTYGRSGDEVLVGDWDGDGCDSLAMRRNGNTYYFCNDITDPNGDTWSTTYGRKDDEVLVGDWEDNGYDSLAVRRNGNVYYFSLSKVTDPNGDVWKTTFGRAADEVLVGDWDGNGTDTLAMRRNGNTYFISNSIANPDYGVDTFTFGRAGDEVYAGTWR